MAVVSPTFRVDFELDYLKKYLEFSDVAIVQEGERLQQEIEEATKNLDQELGYDVYSFYTDEYIELGQEFPKFFYTGFLLIWISFVEKFLINLCDQYKLKIILTASKMEKPNAGIYKARYFLKETAGYEINSDHWQELKKISKLRNIVVHERGEVKAVGEILASDSKRFQPAEEIGGQHIFVKMEENLFLYTQKHSLLILKGPNFLIVPNLEFSRHLIDFGTVLFHKIYDDMEKKKAEKEIK